MAGNQFSRPKTLFKLILNTCFLFIDKISSTSMPPKIAYYLSHPIQNFSPLLKKMAESFDLQVYYFSDASIQGNHDVGFGQTVNWDIPLLDGYRYPFLKNYSSRKSLSNRMLDAVNP